jgi:hypothetical protein
VLDARDDAAKEIQVNLTTEKNPSTVLSVNCLLGRAFQQVERLDIRRYADTVSALVVCVEPSPTTGSALPIWPEQCSRARFDRACCGSYS